MLRHRRIEDVDSIVDAYYIYLHDYYDGDWILQINLVEGEFINLIPYPPNDARAHEYINKHREVSVAPSIVYYKTLNKLFTGRNE